MGILSSAQRAFVAAVAPCIVPAAASLDPAAVNRLLDLVDNALAERPAPVRRQFSLLLTVLRWAPVTRFGRPLDRLDPERQAAVLRAFERAPIQKLRAGFWGFRTLVLLGFYGRPEAGPAIGYRPSLDGNARLHDRTRR